MIKLKEILLEGNMSKEEIQSIVDRVYPKISSHYGRGKRGIPEVTIHSNIYARESGIEGMEGEANPHGQYDWDLNKIYLYIRRLTTEEQVIRTLIHEHTHSLQDSKKREEYRKLGYAKNPYEKAASRAESNWRKYA